MNCPLSWIPPSWPTHTFQIFLFALQIAYITMLWILFLLKKSLVASVIFLLGNDANGMWVLFVVPQILGKPIRSWKQSIIFYKQSLDGILIYSLNNLFLSHRVSHTMSTYFLMVDAPTLNWLAMFMALVPWANL